MVWNSHPTSGILTIAEDNVKDLHLFDNYKQLIIIDLNEKEWQPTQKEGGIHRSLTTVDLIIGRHLHLLYYFLTLINPQFRTALILAATVRNKYYLSVSQDITPIGFLAG